MDTQSWCGKASYFAFQGHQIAYWTSTPENGAESRDESRDESRSENGDINARPLLLVHGFPTCAWDFVPVWDALAARRRLIVCDMLGFGLSDKPRPFFGNGPYSIHLQTDIQEALLAHLGVGEFDALVHDYGVSVGQELLARQNEGSGAGALGQALFLNGGIFPDQHRPRPIQKLGVSPLGFLAGLLMNRKNFGASFSEIFGPDTQPTEAELDEFWIFISRNSGNRITHKLLHYIADRVKHKDRWEAALVGAQDRIGLINGALDPVSGKHAYDRWRTTLPDARHHLIESVGHYPHVEAPDKVAQTVLQWLAR